MQRLHGQIAETLSHIVRLSAGSFEYVRLNNMKRYVIYNVLEIGMYSLLALLKNLIRNGQKK